MFGPFNLVVNVVVVDVVVVDDGDDVVDYFCLSVTEAGGRVVFRIFVVCKKIVQSVRPVTCSHRQLGSGTVSDVMIKFTIIL